MPLLKPLRPSPRAAQIAGIQIIADKSQHGEIGTDGGVHDVTSARYIGDHQTDIFTLQILSQCRQDFAIFKPAGMTKFNR